MTVVVKKFGLVWTASILGDSLALSIFATAFTQKSLLNKISQNMGQKIKIVFMA